MLAHAAKGSDESVAWIARVRAATVLMDLERLPEALQQLEGEPPAAALGMVQDRRGDVLSLMKRWDEARSAWEAAQKASRPMQRTREARNWWRVNSHH